MRGIFSSLLAAGCVCLGACSEDPSSGGGSAVTDANSDSGGDGALGGDDVLSDSTGGCLCQTGYTCVPAASGYSCVPTTDASGDSGGGQTCTQVGQCIEDQCSSGAQPCGLTCANGASADVSAKLTALETCVAQKCQAGVCKGNATTTCMNDCTGAQCGSVLMACFDDGMPGGNSCGTAITCFGDCDKNATTGHFTCMSKCYDALSTLGKTQLKAFTDCLAKGPGGNAGFAACQSEYTTCITGGTTGNSGCADIAKCTANCPSTTGTCPGDCMALGSALAQTEVNAMNACFASTTDQTTCLPKLESCATPAGAGKCSGVQACVDACKKGFAGGVDQGSCTIGCLHATSQVGADAYIALFSCVIPKCPGCTKGDAACTACLNSQCPSQLAACTAN